MSEYKGLAFDFDGTAVTDGALEVRSRRLIRAAKAIPSDILTVGATGRIREHAMPIARQLDLRFLIATNGAHLLDVQREQTVWERVLSTEQVVDVLSICNGFDYQLALDGDPMDQRLSAREQVPRACAGAFLLNAPREVAESVHAAVREIPGTDAYISTGWAEGAEVFDVNIGHSEAGKDHALTELAGMHDLELDDFVFVGDGPNDVALAAIVGQSAAVANACPELLAVADEVVPSLQDDGLSHVIEKYFLGQQAVNA